MRIPIASPAVPAPSPSDPNKTEPLRHINHAALQPGRAGTFTSAATMLLAVLLFLFSPAAHGQYKGSLRGVVSDPQGAVVSGASVTLLNSGTGLTITATTDDSGIYMFNGLPPATFQITVERSGFTRKVLESVTIIPEQLNSIDISLQVGQITETVTVSGGKLPMDTETATISGLVTSNQIEHMPSFNRDIFQLAQLTPGVFGNGAQGSGGGAYNLPGNQGPGGTAAGGGGIFQTENGPQIQARGGQYETNGISIDGISTVSAVWGGTSIITPSEDSVDSMKVVANSYDAESGRFTGAQIQITSKSGTNEIHGSAFFKASRPGLNAYQRWNGPGSNRSGTAAQRGVNRNQTRFNQYGGSLGGPLWKNKIFAFFNWETSPLSGVTTAQGWYETTQFLNSAAPTGSIAAKYLAYKGEGVSASAIVPRTCASIGLEEGVNCNTTNSGLDIGSPLASPLGYQDLTYGGSITQPGVGGGLDGLPDLALFNTTNPTDTSQMQYNGRIDTNITGKDQIAFALYWVPVDTTFYNGPVRAANLWHKSQINSAFSLIWNRTFSPTLLNQARANAAGWRWNEVDTNPQEPFGLPQANIDNMGTLGPEGNFQYLGAPGPSNLNQWTYSYSDVLTKVLGRHSIKAGAEWTRLYYLNNPIYASRPQFTFHNLWDFANDAPYHETGQFNYQTGIPFANRQDDRQNLWGIFVQDDFRIRPNFTINAGLRWSWFGPVSAKQGNLDVLRFGPASDPLGGLNVRVGGNLYTPQKTNFGPQIGFAWQPSLLKNKAVVRGGFGINYNQTEIAITANVFQNPPNAVQVNFNCDYPFTGNPNCTNTGIQYQTATDINSIFGYPANPAAITTFGSNNLPLSGTIHVVGFPANPKTLANYHYSLEGDYQLPFNMVATLGYQGSLMRHLLYHSNWNVVAGAHGLPFNPRVNYLEYWDNSGNGNYNALIATLAHNFAQGFQLEAQYTWAKAMDENSGPYFMDPYPYDVGLAYGRSDYNVQNAFKLFGLWQPVFFHGNSWLEKLAGGWSLSGIWNVHSGFPWNPIYSTNDLYYQGGQYSSLRPAAALPGAGKSTSNSAFRKNINPDYHGTPTQYFTAPSYTLAPAFPAMSPLPQLGIRRNSLTTPGYNALDGSLTKAFGLPGNRILGERARLEIRADAYNLFNKININPSSINNNVGSISPTGVVSPNSGFGVAGSALGSRTVQLQTRFSF